MFDFSYLDFGKVNDSAQTVLAGVDYLRKNATLDEDDSNEVTGIEGLAALGVVIAAVAAKWESGALSISAQESFMNTQQAAFAIADELIKVANLHLTPMLALVPKFKLPPSSDETNSGGAMSISLGWNDSDPVQDALKDAIPRVMASLLLLRMAVQGFSPSPFPADKAAGKMFAHLFSELEANIPVPDEDLTKYVESALYAAQK